jgi:hypothetical protein
MTTVDAQQPVSVLLLTPQRLADEGPRGYLLRLANANRLDWRTVQSMAPGDALIHSLRAEATVPWLASRPARFCPRCLADSPAWRIHWEILFADACPRHGVWLIDHCSGCGRLLGWQRPSPTHCSCGYMLVEERATAAPQALVRLSEWLAARVLATDVPPLEPLTFLGVEQAVRLIRFLGVRDAPHGAGSREKLRSGGCLSTSWPVSTLAAEVIDQWPTGFFRLLDGFVRARRMEDGASLARTFASLYRAIYRRFVEPEFAFLREAFERYVASNWAGALCRRNRRLAEAVVRRSRWIPEPVASAVAGIPRRRLRELAAGGAIPSREHRSASGRRFVLFPRAEVEALRGALPKDTSAQVAAGRLGLSRRRFAAIRPLVCPGARQGAGSGSAWAIPSDWVDQWLARIADLPAVSPSVPERFSLGAILRSGAWSNRLLAAAINDIASGRLTAAGRQSAARGLASLVLDRGCVEDWRAQRRAIEDDGLSVPEAAVALGIKQEVAYYLVRAGFLAAARVRGEGRTEWRITETQLRRFTDAYVFARDLARHFGRSARWVASALERLAIHPCAGPGRDNSRQLLYRREDLQAEPALAALAQALPVPAPLGGRASAPKSRRGGQPTTSLPRALELC